PVVGRGDGSRVVLPHVEDPGRDGDVIRRVQNVLHDGEVPGRGTADPDSPAGPHFIPPRSPPALGRPCVHGSGWSPAPVSRYPGAIVAGSARTRSTRADPAVSGVSSSPSCVRYSSSVWPPRAAYAWTPSLPTSPNGVILGITAVTVMPSPSRSDSSWAYPAMNRWVALAPAYPPLAGDPLMAAPLLITT